MENKKVIIDGETHFLSRSCSIELYIIYELNGIKYLLANKRGKKCIEGGKWNVISGYLDWDETLEEACFRETFEECGIDISCFTPLLMQIDSSSKVHNQNIVHKYILNLSNYNEIRDPWLFTFNTNNCEPEEVDEIKLIPLNRDIIINYKWAFHQKDTIKNQFLNTYYL